MSIQLRRLVESMIAVANDAAAEDKDVESFTIGVDASGFLYSYAGYTDNGMGGDPQGWVALPGWGTYPVRVSNGLFGGMVQARTTARDLDPVWTDV